VKSAKSPKAVKKPIRIKIETEHLLKIDAKTDVEAEATKQGPVKLLKADKKQEWVELFPHGISVGSDIGRPVLVLKDKNGIEVLPVWMHPLDAGVALAELSNSSGVSPHAVTRRVLESLNVRLNSCTFVDLVGHHQFVQLGLEPLKKEIGSTPKTLRVRADEAMSFCLQARARFFSTRAYMLRCRSLDTDLSHLEQNLTSGQAPGLQSEMEISSKKHPYVM
jgi:hypothetical protein